MLHQRCPFLYPLYILLPIICFPILLLRPQPNKISLKVVTWLKQFGQMAICASI